jgi:hypothetical protein
MNQYKASLTLCLIATVSLLLTACGRDEPGAGNAASGADAAGSFEGQAAARRARRTTGPDFTGVWSGVFTTQEDDYWPLEAYACFVGCMPEAYAMYSRLIDDPANDDRPLQELQGEMFAFQRELFRKRFTAEGKARQDTQTEQNDTVMQCEPYGYVREVTNPLPMAIRQAGGNLMFHYEEWNVDRTIYMDGRDHPADLEPSMMGHSIGHYDGDALVIETVGVKGDRLFSFISGGSYSDQMTGTETYTLREGGRVLHVEFLYMDPVILTEPIMIEKDWIATPGLTLLEDSCEDVPGQP